MPTHEQTADFVQVLHRRELNQRIGGSGSSSQKQVSSTASPSRPPFYSPPVYAPPSDAFSQAPPSGTAEGGSFWPQGFGD
jgi:hypothetical protein